jgi:hypothetical protein
MSGLPCTALPCRLRHQKGQSTPCLSFDPTPFCQGLTKLRQCKYGEKMQCYTPPDSNPFEDDFEDDHAEGLSAPGLASIYNSWSGLHPHTQENLRHFENPEFELATAAEGMKTVQKVVGRAICMLLCLSLISQLGELNDIARLCHCFRLGFDMKNVGWPLLTVEFDSFREQEIDGIFEASCLMAFPSLCTYSACCI